ncbi:MAG: carbohydrate ABC transporter permease [Chloroflexi bacterium]|nr:carbohydrate ABC transporter permease [Chloroflexota bacterium]
MIDARTETSERPAWLEEETRFYQVVKFATFGVITLVVVFPFLSVLATSLASEADVVSGGGLVLWPQHPTLEAYRTIFAGGVITRAIVISLAVTTVGTLASLAVTIAMAYGLSRRIWGGRIILFLALGTLLFTPGIIPNYLAVKQLGLLNSYAALVLPVLVNAFNLIVLRQFFMAIPGELLDSARMDGANDWDLLVRIVLPVSKAVVAVVALFYAVFYWNEFFRPLLYLNDSSMWPLSLVLRLYVVQGAPLPTAGEVLENAPPLESIQMAVVMVAVIPILLVYPFLQRYFTRGVLSGAIKG